MRVLSMINDVRELDDKDKSNRDAGVQISDCRRNHGKDFQS